MAHPNLCFTLTTTVICMFAANSSVALASEETDQLQRQPAGLEQQMLQMQQGYQQQIDSLEQRIDELEKQSDQSVSEPPAMAVASGTSARNSALQIGLSGLFAGGGSSVNNDALENLQAGAHDPNQNGFSV